MSRWTSFAVSIVLGVLSPGAHSATEIVPISGGEAAFLETDVTGTLGHRRVQITVPSGRLVAIAANDMCTFYSRGPAPQSLEADRSLFSSPPKVTEIGIWHCRQGIPADPDSAAAYLKTDEGKVKIFKIISSQPIRFATEPQLAAQRQREERQREASEERAAELAALRPVANENSTFNCRGSDECRKAFSLSQVFITRNSDMKIQVSTDTIIETYNPTDNSQVGLRVMRIPLEGDAARIVVEPICRGGCLSGDVAKRALLIQGAFRPFLAENVR